MKSTRKILGMALLAAAVFAAAPAFVAADELPENAIALDDPKKNIITNGVRVRFTHTAWDYVKVILRDTMKKWDYKGGDGFNTMLDPGYQPSSRSAGPARNTPVAPRWTTGGQFMQNRKWGTPGSACNMNDTVNGNARGFPNWDLQNLNREQGFYVNKSNPCWDAINVCSKRVAPWNAGLPGLDITTPHQHGPATTCDVDPIYFYAYVAHAWIYINILVTLFPTMYLENQPSPVDGWDPPDRWPYTGLGGRWYGAEQGGVFPTSGAYNPMSAYNSYEGSYFRAGDDTAMYLNISQMQVQAKDRDGTSMAAPRGVKAINSCGQDWVYSGNLDASNEPIYYLADVPQCMRPKMYWKNGTSNVNTNIKLKQGEVAHWEVCDAYDTIKLDGTANPAKDDAEALYPGNNPGLICGAGSAVDVFDPTNAGWYGLKLDYMDVYSESNQDPNLRNTLSLQMSGKDIRIELGMWADIEARTCTVGACWWATGWRFTRKFVTGMLQSDYVRARAKIRLYTIDDKSCVSGGGNDCSGFWKGYDNNTLDPDKLIIDIEMNPSSDIDLANVTFNGASSCLISIFGYCALNMTQVINMVSGMITSTVKDALGPKIKDALKSLAVAVPNFNSLLGDPMNLKTALIDVGLYPAGDKSQATPGSNPLKWPLRLRNGPDGEATAGGGGGKRQIGDLRFGVGFKPIAFRPPGANNIMAVDANEPPLANSTYGVPALIDPDTSGCGSCSGTSRYPAADTDGIPDAENYVNSGTFNDNKALPNVSYQARDIIKEYWKGPIDPLKKPPTWCVTPTQLRTGASGLDFAHMYPRTAWLSFDNSMDKTPDGKLAPRNTVGAWDQMPANTVLRQNDNSGAKEPGALNYDLSIHVHQSIFAELVQAIVASGAACVDFSTRDETGAETPWASFLSAKSFASIVPEVISMFADDTTISVRLTPVVTPHVRTGVGRLSYVPLERQRDPIGGPLPIVNERYTIGMAVPDMKIEIVAHDKVSNTEVNVLTAYWSTTFGLYLKAVRSCYKLDPLVADLECLSTQVNERRVSGYYEFFLDTNSASLAREFENGRDGILPGQFTQKGIGAKRGEAAFVITSTLCSVNPAKCGRLGLSQAVPTLLESMIQIFLVTRFTLYNFTVDFLYVGPDGPNEDLVGGGDYLGIYARFLGDLDVFSLLQNISMAPSSPKFLPTASVRDVPESAYYTTNSPNFEIDLADAPGIAAGTAQSSYSYRIDDGFWHTPVTEKNLQPGILLEGVHRLSIRTFSDTRNGAFGQVVPQVVPFVIDSVAPEIKVADLKSGYFTQSLAFTAHDLQTPDDRLAVRYSLDGAAWRETTAHSVPLSELASGRHTLRVRAADLAGNENEAVKVFYADSPGCGCNTSPDASAGLIMAVIVWMSWRRWRMAA